MKKENYLLSRSEWLQGYLVKETCRYLENNISEKHTLDGISGSMATNRSKLAASFKKNLGISVFEYLRRIRMEKAKLMLTTSIIPIQQVSFEVGYENSANFSTTYKKYYQISPREHRNLYCDLNQVMLTHSESINDDNYY